MTKRILSFLLVLVLFVPAMAAETYQLVVNAKNPITSISKTTVRNYFLGKATRWPDGATVRPIDLPESNDVRVQFSKQVLGKDPSAVKSHWLTMVFAGRGTPPVQFSSESEVLATVRTSVTAIAYVSADTPLGPGLKAIPVTN